MEPATLYLEDRGGGLIAWAYSLRQFPPKTGRFRHLTQGVLSI